MMQQRAVRRLLVVIAAAMPLCGYFGWWWFVDLARSKPPTVSAEVTRITGPLRPDGFVDYVAALDAASREGVVSGSNAAVPLAALVGLESLDPELRAEFWRRLGAAPPADAPRLPSRELYRTTHLEKDPGDGSTFKAVDRALAGGPWRDADYPFLAAFLAQHREALDAACRAVERPQFYAPLLGNSVAVIRLPIQSACPELAEWLTIRGKQAIGAGDLSGARRDLRAALRLSLLLRQGSCAVDWAISTRVESTALQGILALLDQPDLPRVALARELFEDLAAAVPSRTLAERIDEGERYVCLDDLRLAMHGVHPDNPEREAPSGPSRIVSRIDADVAARIINEGYDALTAAIRLGDSSQTEQALADLFSRFEQEARPNLFALQPRFVWPGAHRHARSVALGNMLLALHGPVSSNVFRAEPKNDAHRELLRVSIALAEHRIETGKYPQRLDALVPTQLDTMPRDPFTDGLLIYRRTADGYRLESVGPNGVDDPPVDESALHSFGEDDLVVVIPRSAAPPSP